MTYALDCCHSFLGIQSQAEWWYLVVNMKTKKKKGGHGNGTTNRTTKHHTTITTTTTTSSINDVTTKFKTNNKCVQNVNNATSITDKNKDNNTDNDVTDKSRWRLFLSPEDDHMFPAMTPWVAMCVTLVIRVIYVIDPGSWWVLHPDEVFQSMDVAHSQVYGYGFRPYEFIAPYKGSNLSHYQQREMMLGMNALRSPIVPQIYAIVATVLTWTGWQGNPFLVWRILHVVLTSTLPLVVYFYAKATGKSHDVASGASILTSASAHLNIFGTHTLINSFISPFLFISLARVFHVLKIAAHPQEKTNYDDNNTAESKNSFYSAIESNIDGPLIKQRNKRKTVRISSSTKSNSSSSEENGDTNVLFANLRNGKSVTYSNNINRQYSSCSKDSGKGESLRSSSESSYSHSYYDNENDEDEEDNNDNHDDDGVEVNDNTDVKIIDVNNDRHECDSNGIDKSTSDVFGDRRVLRKSGSWSSSTSSSNDYNPSIEEEEEEEEEEEKEEDEEEEEGEEDSSVRVKQWNGENENSLTFPISRNIKKRFAKDNSNSLTATTISDTNNIQENSSTVEGTKEIYKNTVSSVIRDALLYVIKSCVLTQFNMDYVTTLCAGFVLVMCLYIRPDATLLVAILALGHAHLAHLPRLLVTKSTWLLVLGGIFAIIWGILEDFRFYQVPVISPWQWTKFNLLSTMPSQFFGTVGFSFYLENIFFQNIGMTVLSFFFILSLWFSTISFVLEIWQFCTQNNVSSLLTLTTPSSIKIKSQKSITSEKDNNNNYINKISKEKRTDNKNTITTTTTTTTTR